jgi:hypothetical protein
MIEVKSFWDVLGSSNLGLLGPKDEGTVLLPNVGNYLLINKHDVTSQKI